MFNYLFSSTYETHMENICTPPFHLHAIPTPNPHKYHAYIHTHLRIRDIRIFMGEVITNYICVICIIITLHNTSTRNVYTHTRTRTTQNEHTRVHKHTYTHTWERTLLKYAVITTHTHTHASLIHLHSLITLGEEPTYIVKTTTQLDGTHCV